MNLIQHIFSEATVQAIGWTLLHSLWQGAMVALILGGLLVLLHRHSARIRYRVAGGTLLAQLLLSVATFAYFYVTSESHAYTSQQLAAPEEVTAWQEQTAALSFREEPLLVAQVYFAQHLPLIVMAWLLGLLAMMLRFVGGIAYTQRLRHYRTSTLGVYWHELAGSLGQKMDVSQTVRLVESAMVHVPMTIGYLKPVILLPLGAVAGLSQQQVEAILAHELAHILRKDYLFNLLQSIIEILFFYHPAVWWMSAVVRAEREHCCDDLAVAACGDSLTYARALAELKAMRISKAPALAMALAGRKGSLLSRIKRLVSQPSLRPTFSEGFMAALVLIVGLVILSYGAVAGLKPVAEKEVTTTAPATAEPAKEEKIPEPTEATAAEVYTVQDTTGQAQDVVIIKNKKGNVTELYVNGKRIPKKDIPKYTDLVNQRLQATARAPKATKVEVAAGLKAARAAANKPRRENEEYRYNYTFSGSDSIPPVPPAPPMPPKPAIPPMPHIAPPPPMPPMPPMNPFSDSKEDKKRIEKEQQRYKEEMEKYKLEIKRYEKEMKEQHKGAFNEQRFQEQMKRHEEAMERHAEHQKKHEAAAIRHEEQAKKMKDLREELEKDGLVKKGAKSLNLRLDNSGLYIDGKKQPQEVYEKYRKMTQTKEGKDNTFSIQINDN